MADARLVHIVDDEDSVRRSLDFLLRSAGYRTERWEDGVTFLKGADKAEAACVLLDVRMPGMDGLQVQAEMAAQGFNFPVVVLTGHGDIATAVRAMRGGAVDFLEKPFNRERLLDALGVGFAQIDDREAALKREEWAKTEVGKLTPREAEVLEGLACGYPNKTIAYDLGISSRTVEVHRANVMVKFEVSTFADALRIAFAAGMGSEKRWRETYNVGGAGKAASASD
jgi:two-component system, LuxR family, response regulator FixJ